MNARRRGNANPSSQHPGPGTPPCPVLAVESSGVWRGRELEYDAPALLADWLEQQQRRWPFDMTITGYEGCCATFRSPMTPGLLFQIWPEGFAVFGDFPRASLHALFSVSLRPQREAEGVWIDRYRKHCALRWVSVEAMFNDLVFTEFHSWLANHFWKRNFLLFHSYQGPVGEESWLELVDELSDPRETMTKMIDLRGLGAGHHQSGRAPDR